MEPEVEVSAPFRLSVAGGGSDLPAVFQVAGGELLTVALQHRLIVRVAMRRDGLLRTAQGRHGAWSSAAAPAPAEGLVQSIVAALAPQGADVRSLGADQSRGRARRIGHAECFPFRSDIVPD